MMMIHNPWTVSDGNANEFRKLADDLDKIRESLISAYEDRTMLNREEIIEIMDKETWLTAKECEEYGLCDVVEEEKMIAACVDLSLLKAYKNTPKELIKNNDKDADDTKPEELLKQKILIELEL